LQPKVRNESNWRLFLKGRAAGSIEKALKMHKSLVLPFAIPSPLILAIETVVRLFCGLATPERGLNARNYDGGTALEYKLTLPKAEIVLREMHRYFFNDGGVPVRSSVLPGAKADFLQRGEPFPSKSHDFFTIFLPAQDIKLSHLTIRSLAQGVAWPGLHKHLQLPAPPAIVFDTVGPNAARYTQSIKVFATALKRKVAQKDNDDNPLETTTIKKLMAESTTHRAMKRPKRVKGSFGKLPDHAVNASGSSSGSSLSAQVRPEEGSTLDELYKLADAAKADRRQDRNRFL
jgi:hypothetical protein